jgi:transposase-like protein
VPSRPRKQFTPAFKAKVAIEAIKGERTATEIARTFSVHPNLVGIWKRQALEGLPDVFASPRQRHKDEEDAEKDELYRKIGQLKVELDWIKKKSGFLG